MPDRLDRLRHQRALVQEQLAWIDREIAELSRQADAGAAPAPPTSPAATPTAQPNLVRPTSVAQPLPDFPEDQADAASMQSAARRGCLMYAVLAVALLIAGAVALYFVAYRDHPLFFAGEKSAPAST
jgi:hypothetical protein